MNSRTILYTANAGFFLTVNHITLAVDAFPRIGGRGFSALSQEDFETLCQRTDLTDTRYVITTHDHADHYSARWMESFLAGHPTAKFIGAVSAERAPKFTINPIASPSSSVNNHGNLCIPTLLHGDHPTYYLPGITFEFLRLPHEGAEFSDVANYGCLVTFAAAKPGSNAGPGIALASGTVLSSDTVLASDTALPSGPCRVLFLGDAKPADPAIADWISGRSIDLALLNFPWVTLPKGRRFLDEHLPNTEIAVLHLPYEQDDRNRYNQATEQAVRDWRPGHVALLTAFGQSVRF